MMENCSEVVDVGHCQKLFQYQRIAHTTAPDSNSLCQFSTADKRVPVVDFPLLVRYARIFL